MTDQTTNTETAADTSSNGTTGAITIGGVALLAIGLMGAVALWSEMSGDSFGDPDYTTVEKWLAVLAGLTVAGLGMVTLAIAALVSRSDDG